MFATSLDLNMGYYHIELTPNSSRYCTIVLPWGKYEYLQLPRGLCNSPDIFQESRWQTVDARFGPLVLFSPFHARFRSSHQRHHCSGVLFSNTLKKAPTLTLSAFSGMLRNSGLISLKVGTSASPSPFVLRFAPVSFHGASGYSGITASLASPTASKDNFIVCFVLQIRFGILIKMH